jgi:hypothetical protein
MVITRSTGLTGILLQFGDSRSLSDFALISLRVSRACVSMRLAIPDKLLKLHRVEEYFPVSEQSRAVTHALTIEA